MNNSISNRIDSNFDISHWPTNIKYSTFFQSNIDYPIVDHQSVLRNSRFSETAICGKQSVMDSRLLIAFKNQVSRILVDIKIKHHITTKY